MTTMHPETILPETIHTTATPARAPKIIGVVTVVLGVFMSLIGGFTWFTVQDQLAAQNITVSADAPRFAGQAVDGPFTAFTEAQVINEHALDATGGLTYAEMDREDPARATAMNAAFLQASLFTSVIAFGVAALVTGLGIMFVLTGAAVIGLAKSRR